MRKQKRKWKRLYITYTDTHEKSHEMLFIRIDCLFFDLKFYATFIWQFLVLCLPWSFSLCTCISTKPNPKRRLNVFFPAETLIYLSHNRKIPVIKDRESIECGIEMKIEMRKEKKCYARYFQRFYSLHYHIRPTNNVDLEMSPYKYMHSTKWYYSTYNWLTSTIW